MRSGHRPSCERLVPPLHRPAIDDDRVKFGAMSYPPAVDVRCFSVPTLPLSCDSDRLCVVARPALAKHARRLGDPAPRGNPRRRIAQRL